MYDLTLIKTNKEEITSLGKKLGFSEIYFIEKTSILRSINEIKPRRLNIILGGNDELNRKILTSRNATILLNPESNIKDSIKQVNSGLNQVLCELASKNKIDIAFSLDRLQNTSLIPKIMQNIRLCRKYRVRMLFFTLAESKYELRSARDLVSLLTVLGMTPLEAKYALAGIGEILKEKCL